MHKTDKNLCNNQHLSIRHIIRYILPNSAMFCWCGYPQKILNFSLINKKKIETLVKLHALEHAIKLLLSRTNILTQLRRCLISLLFLFLFYNKSFVCIIFLVCFYIFTNSLMDVLKWKSICEKLTRVFFYYDYKWKYFS